MIYKKVYQTFMTLWYVKSRMAKVYKISYIKIPNSGDSWMYPYQRTPMLNPYISPI